MSYFFSVSETTRFKATDTSLCPVVPGQYLICTDSGDVFYDTKDGVRKHLTDIIDLETDAERAAILAPLDKVYFVKEVAQFWRYLNGEWVNFSTSTTANVTNTQPYIKTFAASEWQNNTLEISAAGRFKEAVLAKVYMLSDGIYSDKCLAAMDTTVSVVNGKVILSYDGEAYDGKVVLINFNANGNWWTDDSGTGSSLAGAGVPDGGTAGQVLVKVSADNQDVRWKTLTASDVGALSADDVNAAIQAALVGAMPDTQTLTAADVGAIPASDVQEIQCVTETEYNALSTKPATTLYLIEG